jgi:hypothetical protein
MINKPGFFCGCNIDYFQSWGRVFGLSVKTHAPWAHVHYHIFDGTESDIDYCQQQGFTVSTELTPEKYNQDIESRKAYWSNMRWVRAAETFDKSTPVISIDADSIMVRDLPQQKFLQDLQHSWVPTAPKREQLSLASAVGYGLDNAREIYSNMMLDILKNSRLAWADDQKLLDIMISNNQIQKMDLQYTDFKFRDDSYIWTGKGDRKFKVKFNEMLAVYK